MTLVLIGPPGAGKSTVGALLADRLGRAFVDADEAATPFYAEVGWSVERLGALTADVGYDRAHRAWEDALAHAVERLLEVHPAAVVALGAGHTHPTRQPLFDRVARALSTAGAVVLIRPTPDPVTAVPILRQRCLASKGRDWIRDGVDWLERWSADGRDEQLATWVADNADEPPERTVERIVAAIRRP